MKKKIYNNWDDALQYTIKRIFKKGSILTINSLVSELQKLTQSKKLTLSFLPVNKKSDERQPIIKSEVENAFYEMQQNNKLDFIKPITIYLENKEISIVSAGNTGKSKIKEVSEVVDIIKKYSESFFDRKWRYPTFKQVQSRLRRKGNFTCKELKKIIESNKESGIQLSEDTTLPLSQRTVIYNHLRTAENKLDNAK